MTQILTCRHQRQKWLASGNDVSVKNQNKKTREPLLLKGLRVFRFFVSLLTLRNICGIVMVQDVEQKKEFLRNTGDGFAC